MLFQGINYIIKKPFRKYQKQFFFIKKNSDKHTILPKVSYFYPVVSAKKNAKHNFRTEFFSMSCFKYM